ncbi:MAG: hypothetical protein ACPGVD_03495 [Flavobacteriales bacterium]
MNLCENKIERNKILEIFEEAFKDSPGMTWMIANNKKKMKSILKLFIHEASLKKGAFLTKNKSGAVLFFSLQNNTNSTALILRKLYVFFFVVGVNRGIKAIRYKKLINEIRPKEGLLGWLVASNQNISGNEAAYEIKREMFRIADETNQPIFVETTVPRVRKLYRLAGYKEYQSIQHPYEELTIWFMRRDPENKKS